MFWKDPVPAPQPVTAGDLAGSFAFYDDGWPGRLVVPADGGGASVEATLHSYRFRADYRASIALGRQGPRHVGLVVHDFNELSEQVFSGWLAGRGGNAIAGRTDWKGEPFGFVARRTRPRELPQRGSGPIRPDDFAGSYSLHCDGHHATVHLALSGPAELAGTVHPNDGEAQLPVTARIGPAAHQITLEAPTVGDAGGHPVLSGLLFTRPRTVIAGEGAFAGVTFGFHLTRFGDGPGAVVRRPPPG